MTSRRDDSSPVLTRTIGDPSTGTDPLTPGIPEESSPSARQSDLPPSSPSASSATMTAGLRPQFLELPARPDFSLDQIPVLHTPGFSSISAPSLSRIPGLGDPASASIPAPQPGQAQEPLRVLVVDDDPLTRKLMSRMLSRLGNRVSTAENGEIALEMILGVRNRATPSSEETGSAGLYASVVSPAEMAHGGSMGEGTGAGTVTGMPMHEYKYAVVFLDNQMPVMSGLELVAKLREMGRQDFVVGVTGEWLLLKHPPQATFAASFVFLIRAVEWSKCLIASFFPLPRVSCAGNALLSDQQEYIEAGADQ